MNSTNLAGGLVEPGSFRDRHGRVLYYQDRVYRCLNKQASAHWRQFCSSGLYQLLREQQLIVETNEVDAGAVGLEMEPAWSTLLRHEKIPVISYPYEWPFSMLKDAALLQLKLMQESLAKNWVLKDASAFNVQWNGSKPVFIDIPSFKPLAAGDPWEGYQQFCCLFLYPLMLQAYKGVAFHTLLKGDIDGIEPADMAAMMSLRDWFRSGVLTHVVLQAKLQRQHSTSQRNVKSDLKSAGFSKALIEANVTRLQRLLNRIRWQSKDSQWSGYSKLGHYSTESKQQKYNFVEQVAASQHWETSWDIGCNTGEYARLLAEHSNLVVAMDADHLAIDRFYNKLAASGDQRILPLVINLNNPSPALGWMGNERKTLEHRSNPNLVCCLALIHHIVITANVPLAEFVSWLVSLKCVVVIEFVTKQDPMVKTLLRNKEDIYDDYEIEVFESCIARHFSTVKQNELITGQRFIYHLAPK